MALELTRKVLVEKFTHVIVKTCFCNGILIAKPINSSDEFIKIANNCRKKGIINAVLTSNGARCKYSDYSNFYVIVDCVEKSFFMIGRIVEKYCCQIICSEK
jgi:hypothetical protein